MSSKKRTFTAGWGDMDFNGHMRNTAYLDVAADRRMMFFEENGFTMRDFEKLLIGPVVKKDEIEYFRELRLLEHMEVDILLAGICEDGSRFRIRNIFYKTDGKVVAIVTSTGGWLSISERKLVSPPEKLLLALKALERTDDFETLPNSIR